MYLLSSIKTYKLKWMELLEEMNNWDRSQF